jgi:hypothetical protein
MPYYRARASYPASAQCARISTKGWRNLEAMIGSEAVATIEYPKLS